ncbi:hypothetical protein MASR1M68_07420 [Elusimicrobiota bacterium]
MSTNLLVISAEHKDSIDKKHAKCVDKILNKHEVFYFEKNSLDILKTQLLSNSYDTIVFAYPELVKNHRVLRVIKVLNPKAKLVLLSPQISNLKEYVKENDSLYDDVYRLLKKSSAMEVSNCQLADAVVFESADDVELLKKEIPNINADTIDEVIAKGLTFKDKPKYLVSIVMLTYNQLDDTQICVESLLKHTTDVNYELIFVDNGSTKDNTKTYLEGLKEKHSNVKVIFNDTNLGFACANNQGIEISEGEYVLLLNNDVILTEGWLSRMLLVAESDKKTGIVGPCTNHASGRQVVVFDGSADDDEAIQQFAKSVLSKNAGFWFSVSRIIGFCVLIKREVLFNVGVLDEMFGPGGYEDFDYCMRVKQAGYNIVISGDTFIYHIGGKGYSANNMNYNVLRTKNIELLIEKWTKNVLEIMEKLPDGM